MTKKIHLAEALCGFHMVIKHLDKRDLIVKYPAGQVIEPGKGFFLVRTSSGPYYHTTYKYTCKSTYNLVQIKSQSLEHGHLLDRIRAAIIRIFHCWRSLLYYGLQFNENCICRIRIRKRTMNQTQFSFPHVVIGLVLSRRLMTSRILCS